MTTGTGLPEQPSPARIPEARRGNLAKKRLRELARVRGDHCGEVCHSVSIGKVGVACVGRCV